jgi:chitodextrinase
MIVFLLDESSDVTITNSTLSGILLHNWPSLNSNLRLINTVVNGFDIRNFFGNLCFENATWTEGGDGWIHYSVFYMSGNVSGLSGLGRIFWLLSNVTRNYGIIVKDRYDEPTVSDASLILLSEEDVIIWNGTTGNQGEANFNLTFADGNYTDTLRLEAVKGEWSSTKTITFLSDTPVIFTSPLPPSPVASFKYSPEKSAASEQITFNASESYSPKGNVTSFEWNFDDGNITTITEPLVNHTYALPGRYNVTLKVTDTGGLWKTTTKTVIVCCVADLNKDGTVDIYDAIMLASAYNSKPSSLNWNSNADINGDNVVDIYDAILLANNYGKTA